MQTALDRDLFDRLRQATAECHDRLHAALPLDREALSQHRIVRLLRRFMGFHLVWEPAVAAHPALRALMQARSRISCLQQDLHTLGASAVDLPACAAAGALAATPAEAMGSLYVMEGSTLGGQVVGRMIAGQSWAPAAGLRYFQPYGDRTGAMWREFKDWGRVHWPASTWPAIEDGATATFDGLHHWLTAGSPP